MTTYTNLGIKQIDTGAEAGTWGTSTNTNFDYFDQAIVGYAEVTLTTAGSTGTPNLLEVLDYAPSDGRSRIIEFTSAADLGANAYVQISPSDFQGYYFVRNSLPGSRSVILFQGDWDAGRDFEVTAGADVVVFCSGTGSISTVKNLLAGLQISSVISGDITGDTITATTEFVGPGDGLTGTADELNIGGNAATSTTTTNVNVTNDISSGGVYYPTFVINTVGAQGVRTSSTKLTYQPSTGTFYATILSSPTGNITTGNITTGNITTGNITTANIATLNVSGNTPAFSGTGAVDLTAGTTAQRPASPSVGMIRYNTTTGYYEVYTASGWLNLATDAGGSPVAASIEYGSTITVSGNNQYIDFTSIPGSTVKRIQIIFYNLTGYPSGYLTGLVLGTSSGFVTTGYSGGINYPIVLGSGLGQELTYNWRENAIYGSIGSSLHLIDATALYLGSGPAVEGTITLVRQTTSSNLWHINSVSVDSLNSARPGPQTGYSKLSLPGALTSIRIGTCTQATGWVLSYGVNAGAVATITYEY